MIPFPLPTAEICQLYNLGSPLELKSITGGRLHQLAYLRTTLGEYAIKIIQPENLQLQTDTLSPEKSQQIASLMRRRGIPTVVALKINDSFTYSIAKETFMIMPWINGSVLSDEKISASLTHIIGKQLAKIQQEKVEYSFSPPNWIGHSKKVWENLLLLNKHHIEFEKIYAELNNLVKWSQEAESAQAELTKKLILSHRDLDPKNVIWSDSKTPCILDWEYAGLIHPQLDLFIVALNWSEVLSGVINLKKFKSLVSGFYQEKSAEFKPFNATIIAGYIGYCLAWLTYNFKKLPHHTSAITEILQTLLAIKAAQNLNLDQF